jgi:hypothetical protein
MITHIYNKSSYTFCGIAPETEFHCFGSNRFFNTYINELVLHKDDMVVTTIEEKDYSEFNGDDIESMLYESRNRYFINKLSNAFEEVEHNIQMGFSLIGKVRYDAIEEGLHGIGAINLATKVQTAVALTQIGMLKEASYYLSQLEPDEFLTPKKIKCYSNMALSADEISK